MNAPSRIAFRFSALMFAAVLAVQCIWILLAELSRPVIDRLPTDSQSAAVAAEGREDAAWAASIGAFRGDLWADSAFTFADLLWAEPSDSTERSDALAQAHARLDRAIDYAPHRAEAWLLMAGLASHHEPSRPENVEALKMSYYTGPSDLRLLPLRLLVAARSQALGDAEVQQLVRRDLRLLLAHGQQPAIAEAYRGASPVGRRFVEQTLGEIDPAYLGSLRTGARKP